MPTTNTTTDLQSSCSIPVTQTRCNASESTGNINNGVANSTRSFESLIQTINRIVTDDTEPVDASENQAHNMIIFFCSTIPVGMISKELMGSTQKIC
jgi:hypothetical protein